MLRLQKRDGAYFCYVILITTKFHDQCLHYTHRFTALSERDKTVINRISMTLHSGLFSFDSGRIKSIAGLQYTMNNFLFFAEKFAILNFVNLRLLIFFISVNQNVISLCRRKFYLAYLSMYLNVS